MEARWRIGVGEVSPNNRRHQRAVGKQGSPAIRQAQGSRDLDGIVPPARLRRQVNIRADIGDIQSAARRSAHVNNLGERGSMVQR